MNDESAQSHEDLKRTQHSTKSAKERTPLGNISAKMQSSSAELSSAARMATNSNDDKKAPSQAEFGKSSPLRNPLLGQQSMYNPLRGPVKHANIFIEKKKKKKRFAPPARPKQVQPSNSENLFDDDDDAIEQLRAQMNNQPRAIFEIPIPTNRPTTTTHPQKQMFSSVAMNAPATSSKMRRDDGDDSEDDFDPEAALRFGGDKFGAVDPYMYQDAEKANSNIKNLLEGAFDDELDKPHERLRRRVKRAPEQPTNLSDKLSALSVADKDHQEETETEDDGTVEGLKVKLLPHQIDGVSWMIDKESGKRKNGVLPRGGILADDMGLGKTVQSVALILLNPKPAPDAEKAYPKQKLPSSKVDKCTLVVAPLALIRQWEDEIKTKVEKSHALRVLVHHGTNRTKSPAELKKYDVVITTYQILTSEHAASQLDQENGKAVGCFGVHWYRVILDESHSIKNRNAKSSIACCDLQSWNRWCLTGTPMQNNLDELQSLIKFLRIKPYCELSTWKQQIIQPIKSGRGGLAMKRLHYYLNAFMKRRTKDVLKSEGGLGGAGGKDGGFKLVKREVINKQCTFNTTEQIFYDRLSERANNKINAMLAEGEKTNYMGALVLLLRLRQACNHPALVEKSIDKDKEAVDNTMQAVSDKAMDADMDDLAALMEGVSVKTRDCDVCGLKLSDKQIKDGASRCDDCVGDLEQIKAQSSKGKDIRRRQRRVVEDSDDEEDESEDDESQFSTSPDDASTDLQPLAERLPSQATSTKVSEIVEILRNESKDHKTIVFSQFTSMLDIIQPHIEQRYVRYDGSMRPEEREKALDSLRNDKRTRVLLCSLKCGSLGLNLTAASRVIIVEPFWNPFVEEQAIDRVHRLNQTVDVKVYRLTIAGSVEERILALQEKKRELAKAAIEGGKTAGKLSMDDILGLFRSDAQTNDMHEMDRKFAEKIGFDSKIISGSSSPMRSKQERTNRRPEHPVYGRR